MSLLPEKPLVISPSLAATIGLEEATLLHVLSDFALFHSVEQRNGYDWVEISGEQLQQFVPFWQPRDIQRISQNLRDQGIILIGSAPFANSNSLRFAINQGRTTQRVAASSPSGTQNANFIDQRWQPEEELFRQLAQYNIPREFALEQVPEFVTYWSERGEPQRSWGSKFIKQVLRLWRERQTEQSRKNREQSMFPEWRPSRDALDILTRQAGISANFIEDAIPEFVLYWCERGERSSTWNSRFILHIKRQWARYTAVIQNDAEPRPIPADWRPDETVFEVLALANIDRQFAERQVAEFVIYWKDTGRAESSWNTRFLQNVKRNWANRIALPTTASQTHETGKRSYSSGSTRARELIDDLSDRSWAS